MGVFWIGTLRIEAFLFFFTTSYGTSDDRLYWSIWDLKNSQIWRKASPKQDLRRLQKDYETHLKSSTSSHKQALSKESRIWLDWKWTLGEFGTEQHVTINTFFQWMKCQLCKVIVSSSYYFCFLSRDNAFVWKVIKIELLISRHKQQCWAGATYNFRNKSDALINKQTQTHNTSTKTQTNTQKQTHKYKHTNTQTTVERQHITSGTKVTP